MNLIVKRTLVVIIAILLIGGLIWFIIYQRRKAKTTDSPAIITALTPRIGDALPPDIQRPESTATPPPAASKTPAADKPKSAPESNSPQSSTPQPRGPEAARPRAYHNDQLHFSVIMPAPWNASTDATLPQEIFFIDAAQQQHGAVEVYDAPSGETIDSLERIIQGDPNAENFERVSYRGQEGIGYHLKGQDDEHFAFIVNNKIYYVHGSELLTRLNFI